MSRATDGARPWSESAAQVGPRHMSLPPISLLIDAPRQSNSHLHTSSFAAIIATLATPDSHPDCRALLIKIVALHLNTIRFAPNQFLIKYLVRISSNVGSQVS